VGIFVIAVLRIRGWTWLLSMLWVAIGAGGAIYAIVAFEHPGYGEGLLLPPTIQWPSEPQLIIDVSVLAEVAWILLTVPVLMAGLFRLRGYWLRMAGWTVPWMMGLILIVLTKEQAVANLGGNRSVLSGEEIAVSAAWLVLGAVMTWMLAAPEARRSDAPSSSRRRLRTN
jgi:hypothetical protein